MARTAVVPVVSSHTGWCECSAALSYAIIGVQ